MSTASLTANPGNLANALPLEAPPASAQTPPTTGPAVLLPLPTDQPAAAVAITPTEQLIPGQQVLEGRFLERLLLNPQSIPEGEQRLLRQQLQQRLTADDGAPNALLRYQLVATVLSAADGLPVINPQLQQQLARKQAAEVAHQHKPPQQQPVPERLAVTVKGDPQPLNQFAGSADAAQRGETAVQRPAAAAQALSLAIERALTGDPEGLQPLIHQLVAASQNEALPERHQLLLLATLLLDESDPPLTTLDPRTRRRLGQQLLLALKQGHSVQHAVTGSSANQSHRSERLMAARQAIANGTVGERQFEEDEDSLAPELLWSGLGVAPATVKPSQVEAVLENLVDKHSPLLAAQGSLQTFVGQASMDQLLMVVTTLMIKINNISGTFMLQSQKINAAASNQVMENQLQKQIEEADKALEAQEKAKKSGIFGAIFNWITAVVATVAAVITLNPVAIAGAVLLLASAAMETAQLALGSDAPAWLGKLSMGLSIAGGILSAGASLLTNVGKAVLNLGKTLVQAGVKAAFKQLYQGVFKAMSNALTKLVEWFKTLPKQAAETFDQVKNFGKSAINKIKQPTATLKQAGQKIVEKTEKIVAPGNRLETVSSVAKGVAVGTTAVEGGVKTYYDYKGAMLQAEIKKLQNESWLLDTLLEYYQKQRKQLQQGMSDLYRQQGDATAIASDLLKESAGLQSRIAGSLA